MQTIKLGRTGLDVSRICLGCMSYGEPERGPHTWTLGEAASRPFFKKALDLGINFFDTANVYSDGSSEEITGRALLEYARRGEIVLATKVNGRMHKGPNGAGLSRKAIFAEIDASLKRLGTDYVDLYQIHRWDYARADRGDARGAERRRARRQGAAHRRLVDVRVAVRAGAAPVRHARLGALRRRCRTTSTCSTARKSARCCRSARPKASA